MHLSATLALLAALAATQAAPPDEPPLDCKTPRSAVENLFGWQQPGSMHAENAARCLDPRGRTPAARRELAAQIKAVYDGRVLFVRESGIPDNPDYVDESGRARVVVHLGLPELYVERAADGQWLWPKAVLDKVGPLYEDTYSFGDWLIGKIPPSLTGKVFGVMLWQYLSLALLFVLALLVRKLLQLVVTSRMQHLMNRFGKEWASKLVAAIASPGATLVMAGMMAAAYPQLRLPPQASEALRVAVHLLVTFSVLWGAYRLVDVFADALAIRAAKTESKLDDQLVPLARRSLKVLTVVIGALFVLQNLNVDVGSLLAGLGIGGLALAMAAKDTLANFFGSVMIFADKPFQVGDWVVVDGIEGTVEEVGFRSTRVRTFYDSLVTVPNSKIADAKVDNYGSRRYRRTTFTLGLTYDTSPEQMQAFVEGVRGILRANASTRKDSYEVHFTGFGESSLQVLLYFFLKVPDWSAELRERQNIYLEILRLAKALGVSFAFPTRTLLHEYVAAPGAARSVPAPLPPEQLAEVVDAFAPRGRQSRPGGPRITPGGWVPSQPDPQPAEAEGDQKPEAKAG